jgi:spermidine synthase
MSSIRSVDEPFRPLVLRALGVLGLETTQTAHATSLWWCVIVAVTIVSNAALLVSQQAAIRLMAPLIGSSIETWSAILGTFLLGIALGNWTSGKLSDRYSSTTLIVAGLLLGSVSIFLMPIAVDCISRSNIFARLSLKGQILSASFLVCLLPGIALSLVTPPSIRSLVQCARDIGSVSGRIFAWGTFGSLLGNYLTGFVLLAVFGVRTIVDATSLALLLLAVIVQVAGGCVKSRRTAASKPVPAESMADGVESEDRGVSSRTISARNSWYPRALAVVIGCSFASGALEGAAFRILAPLVGVSMFLSAGVVGVILAGMASGNALGGMIATRCGSLTALRYSLAACAAGTLAVAPFWKITISNGFLSGLPMIPQVVAWSFSLFFIPAMALGTITPQVIQLTARDLRRTGEISGQIYAWSTIGCIAGIFFSSWFLIESLGAIRTSILCGIVPVLLMWLMSRSDSAQDRNQSRTLSVALLTAGLMLMLVCKSPYDRESKYFSIAITEDVIDQRAVKMLVLDRLVHSAIDLSDPEFLHYPHERVQGDLTRAAAAQARNTQHTPRILVIGGGGYSFPRWLEAQSDLKDVEIDVVEIDPAVTEIAHEKLGLSRDTRIVSIHMDGRQFVKSAPAASYDLVIQDAVNDLSVPWHLMTDEYNQLIRRLLRPEGMYLLTVIDDVESGQFLASAVRTMASAFSEAALLAPQETKALRSRSVFMISGRNQEQTPGLSVPISSSDLWKGVSSAHVFSKAEVHHLLDRWGSASPLLTDDYAPVDILMSSHFLRTRDH